MDAQQGAYPAEDGVLPDIICHQGREPAGADMVRVRNPSILRIARPQLRADRLAGQPGASVICQRGVLVGGQRLRTDHQNPVGRKVAEWRAAATREVVPVDDQQVRLNADECAGQSLGGAELVGGPATVLPVEQLAGEPSHARMGHRHQHIRVAVTYGARAHRLVQSPQDVPGWDRLTRPRSLLSIPR